VLCCCDQRTPLARMYVKRTNFSRRDHRKSRK
jgi:hypothetical protein